MNEFQVRFASTIESVSAAAWEACANPPGAAYNPFVSHAFLLALERSKSVGANTGWTPIYTLVEHEGALVATAPSFVKSHSLGEYVFDQSWAEAYRNAGGAYYPKIQVAAPFTPVTGRRLLVRDGAPEPSRMTLIAGLRALRKGSGASSLHVTFADEVDAAALYGAGFLKRTGEQFHFMNESYRDFDDFLEALSSRKRKAIRRERRDALAAGVSIERLTGKDIEPKHLEAFFEFYRETSSRKWGRPYLTRAFFDEIGAHMAEKVLLVMAKRGDRYIGGAINFLGGEAIFGRNWGAIEEHPFLHFEVCYYQAIDYAITHGFKRVEAGAQGEHKIARGYRPVLTYSAHEFADAGFAAAVSRYLERERDMVSGMIEEYQKTLPYRRD